MYIKSMLCSVLYKELVHSFGTSVMNGSAARGTPVIREAPVSAGIVAVTSVAIPLEGWALGCFNVF